MPEVEVSRCGSVDSALRKLKRVCDNNRVPHLARLEDFHTKRTEKRKTMKQSAEKRARKKEEKAKMLKEWSKQSHKLTLARQGKVVRKRRDERRPSTA